MNTELGKFLKHLRIDLNENMVDMAKKLDVSVAFLSSVECGKKQIPQKRGELITSIYQLDEKKEIELLNAIDLTRKNVNIDLSSMDDEKKEVSINFARSIKDCSPDVLQKLKELLDK